MLRKSTPTRPQPRGPPAGRRKKPPGGVPEEPILAAKSGRVRGHPLFGASPPWPAVFGLPPVSTGCKGLQTCGMHGGLTMTPTGLPLVLLALVATAQTCGDVEPPNLRVDSPPAALGSQVTARGADGPKPLTAMALEPTRPATVLPPEGPQTAATALDPLDQDSGLRLTHRQRLALVGILAFGAGVAVVLLVSAFIDLMRSVICWLDAMLANSETERGSTHRACGQTHVNEGGGHFPVEDNDT